MTALHSSVQVRVMSALSFMIFIVDKRKKKGAGKFGGGF